MTWGSLYFYYECENCKKKYKYSFNELSEYGEDFGKCPDCKTEGKLIKDGAITKDDLEYQEI